MSEIITDTLFKIVRVSTQKRGDGQTAGSLAAGKSATFTYDLTSDIPDGYKLASFNSIVSNHANACHMTEFYIVDNNINARFTNDGTANITDLTVTFDCLLLASGTEDPTGYVDVNATASDLENAINNSKALTVDEEGASINGNTFMNSSGKIPTDSLDKKLVAGENITLTDGEGTTTISTTISTATGVLEEGSKIYPVTDSFPTEKNGVFITKDGNPVAFEIYAPEMGGIKTIGNMIIKTDKGVLVMGGENSPYWYGISQDGSYTGNSYNLGETSDLANKLDDRVDFIESHTMRYVTPTIDSNNNTKGLMHIELKEPYTTYCGNSEITGISLTVSDEPNGKNANLDKLDEIYINFKAGVDFTYNDWNTVITDLIYDNPIITDFKKDRTYEVSIKRTCGSATDKNGSISNKNERGWAFRNGALILSIREIEATETTRLDDLKPKIIGINDDVTNYPDGVYICSGNIKYQNQENNNTATQMPTQNGTLVLKQGNSMLVIRPNGEIRKYIRTKRTTGGYVGTFYYILRYQSQEAQRSMQGFGDDAYETDTNEAGDSVYPLKNLKSNMSVIFDSLYYASPGIANIDFDGFRTDISNTDLGFFCEKDFTTTEDQWKADSDSPYLLKTPFITDFKAGNFYLIKFRGFKGVELQGSSPCINTIEINEYEYDINLIGAKRNLWSEEEEAKPNYWGGDEE